MPREPPSQPVEEVLAREAERRPRAGIAAILGGPADAGVEHRPRPHLLSDLPSVFLIEALRDAAGQDIGRPGLKANQLFFYDDHTPERSSERPSSARSPSACTAARDHLPRRRDACPQAGFPAGCALARARRRRRCWSSGQLAFRSRSRCCGSDFAGSGDQTTDAARDALQSGVLHRRAGGRPRGHAPSPSPSSCPAQRHARRAADELHGDPRRDRRRHAGAAARPAGRHPLVLAGPARLPDPRPLAPAARRRRGRRAARSRGPRSRSCARARMGRPRRSPRRIPGAPRTEAPTPAT